MPQLLGQWQHFLDDVPADFSLVLQHVTPLAPLLFLALWYCSGVLLVVVHICFVCSGHSGVASLVPWMFWCIFPLSLMIMELSGLDWEVYALCYYIPCLDPPLEVKFLYKIPSATDNLVACMIPISPQLYSKYRYRLLWNHPISWHSMPRNAFSRHIYNCTMD